MLSARFLTAQVVDMQSLGDLEIVGSGIVFAVSESRLKVSALLVHEFSVKTQPLSKIPILQMP